MDPFAPTLEDQQKAIELLGSPRMDVGCGPNPLPGCDYYLDYWTWNNPNITYFDIYANKLPNASIYCRHVLEDLRYPEALLNQCAEKEKGWIETPHPSVEYTRGVDRDLPFRGFFHHYWFIWVEFDTLILCPKYVSVEYFPDIGPVKQFNTYYTWKDHNFKYRILQNDIDFDAREKSYFDVLRRACNA